MVQMSKSPPPSNIDAWIIFFPSGLNLGDVKRSVAGPGEMLCGLVPSELAIYILPWASWGAEENTTDFPVGSTSGLLSPPLVAMNSL